MKNENVIDMESGASAKPEPQIVLYKQDSPFVAKYREISVYFFSTYCLKCMMFLFLCCSMIVIFKTERKSLFAIPVIYGCFELGQIYLCLKTLLNSPDRNREELKEVNFDILVHLSRVIGSLGYSVYLLGVFGVWSIAISTISCAAFSILTYIRFRGTKMTFGSPFFNMIESFQIFFMAYSYVRFDEEDDWPVIALVFTLWYFVLFVIGLLLLVIFLVMLAGFIWAYFKKSKEVSRLRVILFGFLILTVECIAPYYLLQTALLFFKFKLISPSLHSTQLRPSIFSNTVIVLILYLVVIFFAVIPIYSMSILKTLEALEVKGRTIVMDTLPEMINSGYKQISDNFFSKSKGEEKPAAQIQNEPETSEICSICFAQKSELIIKACGHGGFCQRCLTEWMQSNDGCPLCQAAIDEVLVVKKDGVGNLLMKGIISLTRK